MLIFVRGPALARARERLWARCAALLRGGGAAAVQADLAIGAPGPTRSFLWLVPTHRWALALRHELLRAAGLRAGPDPPVVHLEGLLDRCGAEPPALSRALLEMLITEVIETDPQAASAFVNRRGWARAGAVRLLADVLIALHRQGTSIPASCRLPVVGERPAEGEVGDLGTGDVTAQAAAVLLGVEQRLQAAGALDEGARAHRQRVAVTPQRLAARFGAVECAVVEGFDELDAPFLHVLGALRAWAPEVHLLLDDMPDHPELRRHMEPMVDELLASAEEVVDGEAGSGQPPAAAQRPAASRGGRLGTDGRRLTLRVCRTPHDEVVFLARAVKEWALAHPGEALSRVAVTFADPESMAPLVREVFPAWGLPFNLSGRGGAGESLASTPLGQTVLALWRVAAGDFARRDLAALARSRMWRGAHRLHAGDIECEGRELRVAQGLELWRARLAEAQRTAERLAAEGGAEIAESEGAVEVRRERAVRLRRLRAALERLAADLEPLRRPVSLAEALAALRALLVRRRVVERLVKMALGAGEDAAQLHLRAFAALDQLVESVVRCRGAGGDSRRLEPRHACALGTRLFESTALESRPSDIDCVQVLGHLELRGLPWRLVCVGGLVEGAWPRAEAPPALGEESPLTPRRPSAEADLARQRHAFHQILSCGAEQIILTRPATSGDVPQNPSPLFEEAAALVGATPESEPPWKVEDVAEAAQCLAPRELQWVVAAAVDEVVSRPWLPSAEGVEDLWQLRDGSWLGPVARGWPIVLARRRLDAWSPWEGRLADTALLAVLRERTARHVWSATELEDYSRCAWRAAVTRLLGLSAPEEAEDEGAVHRLERGLLIHEILCAFLRDWRARTGRDLADIEPSEADAAWDLMVQVANAHLEQRPAGALLWQIERELLLGADARQGLLEAFVREEAESGAALAPLHLEWRFGWPAHRPPPPGSEGRAPALALGEGLLLRGVVDRVECSPDRTRWAVVDYKTGSAEIRPEAVERGLHLQIPLYALAVQKFLAGPGGRVTAGVIRRVGRLDQFAAQALFSEEKGAEAPARLLSVAVAHAAAIAQRVARGELHWTTRPRKEVCDRCDWQTTCRREEVKASHLRSDNGELATDSAERAIRDAP